MKKMKRAITMSMTLLLFLQTCVCAAASLIHDCPVSSCGTIRNITHPFRLRGDSPHCGDNRYQLDCKNNATVLTLFSGKYHVRQIDYKRYTIRVSDAGVAEDAQCSFMPRYFLHYSNFSATYLGPGLDPLQLGQAQASIAFFNCSGPITDDSRYVAVESAGCGSGGHVYAVVKDSRNDFGFGVKDVKVGCQLKVATYANWGTQKVSNEKVSYGDIHDALWRGFGLSWLYVVCEERCGKGKGCRFVDESSGEVQCDQQDCSWVYDGNKTTYDCGTDGKGIIYIFAPIALYGIGVYKENMHKYFDDAKVIIKH